MNIQLPEVKRIRHYETMFIVKPTLTEEEIKTQIEYVKENIRKNEGEIVACDDWGVRELAYEIQKHKRGYYYIIYFKSPAKSIKELERIYKINENIIRFIFVKYDNKKLVAQWDKMVAEANKKGECK
jgi:small subunit ribosomal protein S6